MTQNEADRGSSSSNALLFGGRNLTGGAGGKFGQPTRRKMQKAARLERELKQLSEAPSKGISCWPVGDKTDQLEASIIGHEDTPYSGGIFKLSIAIPDRYPFEPPQVRFVTPIYHPNIDSAGRICLDILKMPPKGAWKPAHNISTLLKSIQVLLADPNPDDPLMAEISSELKCNKALFTEKAKQWTKKFAQESETFVGNGDPESSKTTKENNNKRHGASFSTQDVSGTKKSKINEL